MAPGFLHTGSLQCPTGLSHLWPEYPSCPQTLDERMNAPMVIRCEFRTSVRNGYFPICACEGQEGRFGEDTVLNTLSFSGLPAKSVEAQT